MITFYLICYSCITDRSSYARDLIYSLVKNKQKKSAIYAFPPPNTKKTQCCARKCSVNLTDVITAVIWKYSVKTFYYFILGFGWFRNFKIKCVALNRSWVGDDTTSECLWGTEAAAGSKTSLFRIALVCSSIRSDLVGSYILKNGQPRQESGGLW